MREDIEGIIMVLIFSITVILSIAIPVTICKRIDTTKEVELKRMELEYQYNNGDYTNE